MTTTKILCIRDKKMLIDLNTIKQGIESIKEMVAGIGSEGYYSVPPSLTDDYKIGELPAYSSSVTVQNGASETRTMGALIGCPLNKCFVPKLNGVLGVKVTGAKGSLCILPPVFLMNGTTSWNASSGEEWADLGYFLSMSMSKSFLQEYHQYNSSFYVTHTRLRDKIKQDNTEFYVPCLAGMPLVNLFYSYASASAQSYVNLQYGWTKIEFFAEVKK